VNNDDHSMANLRGLCTGHHKIKTAREREAGKRRARGELGDA
jgi:hypothetical protein